MRIIKYVFHAFLLATCLSASADTISFTFTTTGTGTLNKVAFTKAPMTVTGSYDTANVKTSSASNVRFVTPVFLTFNIQGFAPVTETVASSIYTITDLYVLTLYDPNQSGFFEIDSKAFTPSDLSGPVSLTGTPGGSTYAGNPFKVNTTGGALSMNPVSKTPTYVSIDTSIVPTPEPSSIALLGTGILGIGVKIRKRLVSNA